MIIFTKGANNSDHDCILLIRMSRSANNCGQHALEKKKKKKNKIKKIKQYLPGVPILVEGTYITKHYNFYENGNFIKYILYSTGNHC